MGFTEKLKKSLNFKKIGVSLEQDATKTLLYLSGISRSPLLVKSNSCSAWRVHISVGGSL